MTDKVVDLTEKTAMTSNNATQAGGCCHTACRHSFALDGVSAGVFSAEGGDSEFCIIVRYVGYRKRHSRLVARAGYAHLGQADSH